MHEGCHYNKPSQTIPVESYPLVVRFIGVSPISVIQLLANTPPIIAKWDWDSWGHTLSSCGSTTTPDYYWHTRLVSHTAVPHPPDPANHTPTRHSTVVRVNKFLRRASQINHQSIEHLVKLPRRSPTHHQQDRQQQPKVTTLGWYWHCNAYQHPRSLLTSAMAPTSHFPHTPWSQQQSRKLKQMVSIIWTHKIHS